MNWTVEQALEYWVSEVDHVSLCIANIEQFELQRRSYIEWCGGNGYEPLSPAYFQEFRVAFDFLRLCDEHLILFLMKFWHNSENAHCFPQIKSKIFTKKEECDRRWLQVFDKLYKSTRKKWEVIHKGVSEYRSNFVAHANLDVIMKNSWIGFKRAELLINAKNCRNLIKFTSKSFSVTPKKPDWFTEKIARRIGNGFVLISSEHRMSVNEVRKQKAGENPGLLRHRLGVNPTYRRRSRLALIGWKATPTWASQ